MFIYLGFRDKREDVKESEKYWVDIWVGKS